VSRAARAHHVLVVDDNQDHLDILSLSLKHHGLDPVSANSVAAATAEIAHRVPDIILLDATMPEVSGFEFLKRLRSQAETRSVPIIMVSALGNPDDIVRGLQAGASDYVTKPVNLPVLLARIRTQLKMGELVSRLQIQTDVLKNLAAFDDLTGLLNRRSFLDALAGELSRCQRHHGRLAIAMMDLDRFKRVNDSHGHAAGDAVLRGFAELAQAQMRDQDVLGRYGGEEFAACFIESDVEGALQAAERIRKSLEEHSFQCGDHQVRVTISIGVTTLHERFDAGPAQLIGEADKALYDAKRGGRNRICMFELTGT
jgi:diguanylate cyclase (GGDEF)-like protein